MSELIGKLFFYWTGGWAWTFCGMAYMGAVDPKTYTKEEG